MHKIIDKLKIENEIALHQNEIALQDITYEKGDCLAKYNYTNS